MLKVHYSIHVFRPNKQEAQRATYRAPEYNVPHLLPHLGFLIGSKNTNLVADIEILLPIKFHQIQFSGFREAALCWQHVINSM